MQRPGLVCRLVAHPGAQTARELIARQLVLSSARVDQGALIALAIDPALVDGGLRLAPGRLTGGDRAGTGVRRHVLTDRHCLPGWLTRWREHRSPELRPIPRQTAAGHMRIGED